MKLLLSITLLLLSAVTASATQYATLAVKAERFYRYEEWASAVAMYRLMLDREPQEADTYSHAIIALAQNGQGDEQPALLKQSMDAHVPLDSIYNRVQKLAFEQGAPQLYVQFLERVAMEFPWMTRNINNRLLGYYTWRRDGHGMIEYAMKMLSGMPENIDYLTPLADGYFMIGNDAKAAETYNRIVVLDPGNYHALLVLGNYYMTLSGDNRSNSEARELARQYLTRAQSQRPTPHVARLLSTL